MMFWSDHDMSGWGYTGMVIGMVLFWALIIVGIIALIRYTTGTGETNAAGLDFYDRLVDQLLAAEIKPVVTIVTKEAHDA